MTLRYLKLLPLAVLLAATVAAAQPFVACIEDLDVVLTTTCGGSDPLPDSTLVQVFWDWNKNGPDAADSLLRVCDNPPNCESGPAGTYNFNHFPMNGTAQGLGPGLFLIDPCLVCVGLTPETPRYYLVIEYPKDHPQIRWTSEVLTYQTGPQDPNYVHWTCAPLK
jgi:hypothetical protein